MCSDIICSLIYLNEMEEVAKWLMKKPNLNAMTAAAAAAKLANNTALRVEAASNAMALSICGQKQSLVESLSVEHKDLEVNLT